jgi:hypothetical protein
MRTVAQVAKRSPAGHDRAPEALVPTPVGGSPAASGAPVVALQRLAGNRAVAGAIQRKLTVSAPGDAFEQEADRAAEAVMREPATDPPVVRRARMPVGLARMCAECAEEERVQREVAESAAPVPAVDTGIEAQVRGLRGKGQPLQLAERAFFEERFGTDFGGVRLHTGGEAAALARGLDARAFTFGSDVVLGAGESDLGGPEGRRLLAHELTHVVQQGGSSTLQRAPDEPSVLEMAAAAAFGGASGAAGLVWLKLPKEAKANLIDRALDWAAKALAVLPADPGLGILWPIFKAGLEGFVARLRSPEIKVEEKVAAMDKIAGILAGADREFNVAYLEGLVKGFFLDGMLGIFILIYDLLSLIPRVWGFIKQVGAAIQGFPEEINALIARFGQFYEALMKDADGGLEELKKWARDPQQLFDILSRAKNAVEETARTKGGELASALVRAINAPGTAKTLGDAVGRLTGMIIWEAVFAALTAGGGAAVTAAKGALKGALDVLGKLVGKVVRGFLKIFEEIRAAFTTVAGWVKKAIKTVKGKIASVSQRLADLLEEVAEFFRSLLGRCREGSLICTWPKHHPFPKYLGGLAEQTLKKIPRLLHYRFHAALDKWKGGLLGRSTFAGLPFDDVVRELRLFYKTAEGGIFAKYLPDFEQAVRETRAAMKVMAP